MNPEEGDLRPQLLDRFALSVEIRGIRDARERVLIMERNLAFEADPEQFRQSTWSPRRTSSPASIEQARTLVGQGHLHQPRPALHRRADRLAQRGRPPRRPGHPQDRPRPGRFRRPHRRSPTAISPWLPSWPCRTASRHGPFHAGRDHPGASCRSASSSCRAPPSRVENPASAAGRRTHAALRKKKDLSRISEVEQEQPRPLQR